MFFILSKLLAFLLKPIIWLLGLLLYSWLGKNVKWKKRALQSAAALLLVLSNPALFNLVIRAWEPDTLTTDQIDKPYDIGILLGGFSNPNIVPGKDRYNLSDRANRFVNTLELYRRGKIKKLLISGGDGRILKEGPMEATEARDFLLRIGIPEENIIIEDESRNTYENALYTQRLLEEQYPEARCLLLTSAWHMRRAQGCFEKVGLDATPFPVDYFSEHWQWTPGALLLPNARVFFLWEAVVKEWVGYVVYGLRGYL